MNRTSAFLVLAACVALAMNGGCARRVSPIKSCPPFETQRSPLHIGDKPPGSGVTSDFESIPRFEDATLLFIQMPLGSQEINLLETACLAARNSTLAELIEAERHAVKCQSRDRPRQAIDLILQGEALERRNKAAGSAAEIFLGLVQIRMQRELIGESILHLDELDATIQAASDAQFATAEGKNELAKGRIAVKRAESELSSAEQILLFQLNLLINIDSKNLVNFIPVHDLNLTSPQIDVPQQTEIAAANRPGIRALQTVMSGETGGEAFYSLLGQFDSVLGIRLKPGPITKRLLRRKLIEKLSQDEALDPTLETRQQQIQHVITVRKQEARIQATEALLNLQHSLEKLSIIQEDIARLDGRHLQLKGKQKIDAKDSYLDLNRNWVEMQQAKTERVEAAIAYETAKVKLLEAQGYLITQCGYDLQRVDDQEVGWRPESSDLPNCAWTRPRHIGNRYSQSHGEPD